MVMPRRSKRGPSSTAIPIGDLRSERKTVPAKFDFVIFEKDGKWYWRMDRGGACRVTSEALRDIGVAQRAAEGVRKRLQPEFQGTMTIPQHLYSGDPGYVPPSRKKDNES